MEENKTRINKFLSETGYCSRREADKLLEEGRITINGMKPELGTKVSADDEIRVWTANSSVKKLQSRFIWLLINLLELNAQPIRMFATTLWITSIIQNAFFR
jgi:23S rRNA pseudouridine2604 synthase